MSTDSTTYCGQCGVTVSSTARFCSACGAAQFADGSAEIQPEGALQFGVLRSLVDVRFRSFITPTIVGFFYALLIILVVLFYIAATVVSFTEDATNGVVVLVLGPFVGMLFILFARVALESRVAQFNIAEHTAKTAAALAQRRTM